ncbi:MAG: S9 family peptidase [Candidatus Aminicenantes bacterium]|nr:S9 family peptidase [Candidatus Aminicenantes bacterium]
MKQNKFKQIFLVVLTVVLFCFSPLWAEAGDLITAKEVLNIKTCSDARISPDGSKIAYTVSVPREANDKPGSAYRELYVVGTKNGMIQPFITGKISIGNIRWSPGGARIGFITKRGEKAKSQVWAIAADGGEAVRLTNSKSGINSFEWHPKESKIVYIATEPKTKKEEALKKKGYGFVFYEENLKHKNLYLFDLKEKKTEQLTAGKTAWSFVLSSDGKTIAAGMTGQNLIDHSYMFKKIYLVDIKTKKLTRLTGNPGKLGRFAFSPDNTRMVYTAALERKDHAVSQVYVIDIASKKAVNLTIPGFRGHVDRAGWKNRSTIYYRAGEGVWPTLSLVPAAGGKRRIILHSQDTGITFRTAVFTRNFKHGAVIGSSPRIPNDLFYWQPGRKLKRLTTLNPRLEKKKLGKQEIISYKARDGQEIEGLLIYPAAYREGRRYPLVVTVHGGPESHYSNGWLSSYSRPGQVLSARGYFVFYPNYRASTGYGVEFALAGYEDAAGKEFDDIADGIDYLIKKGFADP